MEPSGAVAGRSLLPLNSNGTVRNSGSQVAPTAKVVFMTVHEDPDFVRAALAVGGAGYVVKSRLASDQRRAIKEALAGRMFVSPTVTLVSSDEDDL